MTSNAEAATLSLFLLTGQSNMHGTGEISEWPARLPVNRNRIWNFRLETNEWEYPAPPNYQEDRVGPALPMADRLIYLRPGMRIGLIPCSLPETGVDEWQKSTDPTSNYRSCLRQVNRAIKSCPAGLTCEIGGIFHWQGERDANNDGDWRHWRELTYEMINGWRAEFGQPHLPAVVVKLAEPTEEIKDAYPHWNALRRQMDMLRRMFDPKVKMLDLKDLQPSVTRVHYTTPDYIQIGHEAAGLFNKIMSKR